MNNRLQTILETVNYIVEGSRRNWSKEKRLMHARGTAKAAAKTLRREQQRVDDYRTKQEADLGIGGHPVNLPRHRARQTLAYMQGLDTRHNAFNDPDNEDLPTWDHIDRALDHKNKSIDRVERMSKQ